MNQIQKTLGNYGKNIIIDPSMLYVLAQKQDLFDYLNSKYNLIIPATTKAVFDEGGKHQVKQYFSWFLGTSIKNLNGGVIEKIGKIINSNNRNIAQANNKKNYLSYIQINFCSKGIISKVKETITEIIDLSNENKTFIITSTRKLFNSILSSELSKRFITLLSQANQLIADIKNLPIEQKEGVKFFIGIVVLCINEFQINFHIPNEPIGVFIDP